MKTLKQLQEQRESIGKRMLEMRGRLDDDEYVWTEEDEENWRAANDDYNKVVNAMDKVARAEEVQEELERRQATQQLAVQQIQKEGLEGAPEELLTPAQRAVEYARAQNHALRGWFRAGEGLEPTEKQIEAAKRIGAPLHARHFTFKLKTNYSEVRKAFIEYRQQSTAATAGGETIPVGFVNRFELALQEFGGVRQVAEVMRTASGNELRWPTSDDTVNGFLIAENAAISTTDFVTAELILNAFKYSSNFIKISQELLEDEAVDLPTFVGQMAGERVGRIENLHYTTGTGTGQPRGVVTASTLGATAASNSSITAENLVDLLHSVDPAYRTTGAGWMMKDSTVAFIRKIRDTSGGAGLGNFHWQPGLMAGQPDMLLGWPVTVNQDMAGIGASAKTVIFGLLTKYKVRDVADFRMLRLEERFRDNDQTGFIALHRTDGDLLDAGTNPIKHLVHPV